MSAVQSTKVVPIFQDQEDLTAPSIFESDSFFPLTQKPEMNLSQDDGGSSDGDVVSNENVSVPKSTPNFRSPTLPIRPRVLVPISRFSSSSEHTTSGSDFATSLSTRKRPVTLVAASSSENEVSETRIEAEEASFDGYHVSKLRRRQRSASSPEFESRNFVAAGSSNVNPSPFSVIPEQFVSQLVVDPIEDVSVSSRPVTTAGATPDNQIQTLCFSEWISIREAPVPNIDSLWDIALVRACLRYWQNSP